MAMMAWRTNRAAEAFERHLVLKDGVRLRRVRVVRDYGMFDRREATQYYPDIPLYERYTVVRSMVVA